MITAIETRDFNVIKSIMTHPDIYDDIAEDGSPIPQAYYPPEVDTCRYVLITDGGQILGLFMIVMVNRIMAEIHTCLLPSARGSMALEAARAMDRWIWAETDIQRIVTNVPSFNKRAIWFALRSGMRKYGVNPKSYQKDGSLWDSVLLGRSRPEESQCQR